MVAFWVAIFMANSRHERPLIAHAQINEREELQLYILVNRDIQTLESIPITEIMQMKLKPKGFWRMHDKVWLQTPIGMSEYYSCSIELRENIIPSLPNEKR
jgi:hypothetical protein